MQDIIKTLEEEHQGIKSAINDLMQLRQGCPCDAEPLLRLEKLILNHISREDSEIYAPLKKLVKLTPEAGRFLDFSRRNLEDIKISALIFFEKFKGEENTLLCEGFQGDLKRLSDKLNERIELEDSKLFPFLTNLWKNL